MKQESAQIRGIMINETIRASLQGWGLEQVRIRLATGQIPGPWISDALGWVQEQEDAERRYKEEIETRRFGIQMAEAKSASRAAWIAAWVSIAGVVVGAIGIAATIYFH